MRRMAKKAFALLLTLCVTVTGVAANPTGAMAASKKKITGASEYGNHYYKVYDSGLSWEDAEKYCNAMGGHLVTITSQGEQNFVKKLISSHGRNSYWLGAHADKKGNWKWVTREKFSYSNWQPGQPDDYKYENTLMMYRHVNPMNPNKFGEWNDLRSDGTCNGETFFGLNNFGFICEWESAAKAKPINISKVKIKLTKISFKAGKIQMPKVKVTYCGRTLKQGTDYSFNYKFNLRTKSLKITFKGIGEYKGSKTVTFKI